MSRLPRPPCPIQIMLKSSKHRATGKAPLEEEEDSASEEPLLSPEHRSVPALKHWTTLAVVVAGCGLCGSKEPWALGIVAILVAVNLVIAPPRTSVPKSIGWPLLIFALLALGSFLPIAASALPRWRQTAERDFDIAL